MSLNVFRCPLCKGQLSQTESAYLCPACERKFLIEQGIPNFYLPGPERPEDLNTTYHSPEVAEAKNTVFHLGARNLRGMACCMDEIGRLSFPGCRVLEVGMGTGHFTRWMAEVCHPQTQIYAFDFSSAMIQKAAQNTSDHQNITLFRASSRAPLPFVRNTFHIILVRLAPFKPSDQPNPGFHLLRPGGTFFEASTTRGERFDIPPTQWATEIGFESAEYRIWRYTRFLYEEEYLADMIDGPRPPYDAVDMDRARSILAKVSQLRGTPKGIPHNQVETLLIAHRPS